MATANLTSDAPATAPTGTQVLIHLAAFDPGGLQLLLDRAAGAFPNQNVLVAANGDLDASPPANVRVAGVAQAAGPGSGAWSLTAADFLSVQELALQHRPKAILLLGAEAESLEPAALKALATAVIEERIDLAVPRYALAPRAGLVNSAILYPVTRALFGTRQRFPLPIDLGLSCRMAEKLAAAARRCAATSNPSDALVWPVAEAAVAGFTLSEADAGTRTTPQPNAQDLNALLAMVAGSFFADLDAKAAFWQRARVAPASTAGRLRVVPALDAVTATEAVPMIESFRLAAGNLQEIWSLVLPPQSLFGLKRLAAMPTASFSMPDPLWARIVYDFLLAYRLRTINRGHLLGALTPLYLAWVASHILNTSAGNDPERHIDSVAAAFEADKPYLVSRWRWPDRFNP